VITRISNKASDSDAYKQSGSSPTTAKQDGMANSVTKCPVSSKRSFNSENEAVEFEQRNRQQYNRPQQYSYACEDCPAWHLTTTPPGTASMAKTIFPSVLESEAVSNHTGPKGIDTAEVVRLRSSGMTLDAIAKHLGVSAPSVKYHLDKNGHQERPPRLSVLSLSDISRRKAELEAQLADLTQKEERLLENARMKATLVGDEMVIKKNGEQVTISLSDVSKLLEMVEEAKVPQ
jgi:predicted transcriptional regulator